MLPWERSGVDCHVFTVNNMLEKAAPLPHDTEEEQQKG